MLQENTDDRESDLLDLICGREQYLRELAEEPKSKRTLVEVLDDARSTVDRNVRTLAQAGLVNRCNEGYGATLAGRLAVEVHSRHQARLDAIGRSRDLICDFRVDAPVPVAVLREAEIVRPGPVTPDRPRAWLKDRFDESTAVRGAVPVLSGGSVKSLFGNVARDTDASLILPPEVHRVLIDQHADRTRTALETGRLTLHELEEIPFGLFLFDREGTTAAGVVSYGDSGIDGVITNERTEAVSAVQRQFEQWRSTSKRISNSRKDDASAASTGERGQTDSRANERR